MDDEMQHRISMMMKRLAHGRGITRAQTEGDIIALLNPRNSQQRSRAKARAKEDKRSSRAELYARLVVRDNQCYDLDNPFPLGK